jgi:hypothetical protein
VLNQGNIHYPLVHVFFMLGLAKFLQYGTIFLLSSHIDHIDPFAS